MKEHMEIYSISIERVDCASKGQRICIKIFVSRDPEFNWDETICNWDELIGKMENSDQDIECAYTQSREVVFWLNNKDILVALDKVKIIVKELKENFLPENAFIDL